MQSIQLNWQSDELNLIRRIRDEVHRFGITHHRNKRSRTSLKDSFEAIKGIGEETKNKLLKRFRSLKNMRTAGYEAWKEEVGVHKAELIKRYFQGNEDEKL
jgi:excinuclease ABC subunit C